MCHTGIHASRLPGQESRMNILFLYDSLKLGGGDWNRSERLCSALERNHNVSYAYQIVEQRDWDSIKDLRLKAELIGATQFRDAGFDCLIFDGRTHEDADFPKAPPQVLREFSESAGAVLFLFDDLNRLIDGSITVDCINSLTSAAGLIHTLFVHPSRSIIKGQPIDGGLITLKVDQKYLARFERYVADALYRNVHQVLASNPLYLVPAFDTICAGDAHTVWVTTSDRLVETMRSAPPAFASMLRRDAVTVFMTGNIWRDYLSERSPDNVVFVENVVLHAEQYQRERGRLAPHPLVFISYSHVDREMASAISRGLEKLGAKVWLDEKMVPVGANISSSCEAGIRRSDKVLFLITPESLRSDWVRYEFHTAVAVALELKRSKLLVPVVVNVGSEALVSALPEIRDIKYLVLDAGQREISAEIARSILR